MKLFKKETYKETFEIFFGLYTFRNFFIRTYSYPYLYDHSIEYFYELKEFELHIYNRNILNKRKRKILRINYFSDT